MRTLKIVTLAAILALVLATVAVAHNDDTKVKGEGVVMFHGHGAEYWHFEAVKLQRQVERLQRKVRGQRSSTVDYALRLAAAAFPVSLSELRSVARCESGLNPYSVNSSSNASGLFQFLPSTWNGSWGGKRFADLGFSVFDPVANALAAAQTVTRDGGWRQWVCKP